MKGGEGEKLHPLCWHFKEGIPSERQSQVRGCCIDRTGPRAPCVLCNKEAFLYQTAEVVIIRIGQEQELFIEACCFPAGAGSGSPVEPFISTLTMTVCCRAFRAQQGFPHSPEPPELAPVTVRIWQRQEERESLANTYFSFWTVFLSLSFSEHFTQDRKVVLFAFYRGKTEAQKGKATCTSFFSWWWSEQGAGALAKS